VFLTITFEDAASVKGAYEVLKEGSTIVYRMASTTYSSCFVSLIDKFGIRWALMTEQSGK
jgi:PhnB protein